MWKESARAYVKAREEVAAMGQDSFRAYRERWEARAVRGVTDNDIMLRAKWAGFLDALNDEILRRDNQLDSDDYPTIKRLLDYLYAEE